MVYHYRTTFADFENAHRLHMRATPRFALSFWVFLRIFPALGLIAFLLLHFQILPMSNNAVIAIASGVAAVGAWGLVMALVRPFMLRRLYKQLKNGRGDDAELQLEIEDGQIISRVPGVSEGRFLPPAVLRFAEDEKIALLYVSKKRFLLLPKDALDDEGWSTLKRWLVVPMETY